jgi:hypothetical protein
MENLIFTRFTFVIPLSCKTGKPKNLPSVIPTKVSDLTVTLNRVVIDEGFFATISSEFVYSLNNPNPCVSKKTSSGFGKGKYSVTIDNLLINTTYHDYAFSTNLKGTSNGDNKKLNTITVVIFSSETASIWLDRNLGAKRVG